MKKGWWYSLLALCLSLSICAEAQNLTPVSQCSDARDLVKKTITVGEPPFVHYLHVVAVPAPKLVASVAQLQSTKRIDDVHGALEAASLLERFFTESLKDQRKGVRKVGKILRKIADHNPYSEGTDLATDEVPPSLSEVQEVQGLIGSLQIMINQRQRCATFDGDADRAAMHEANRFLAALQKRLKKSA